MATIRTKLMVGIFVILGFAIATGAIIWLGMSSYFEKGLYYVAYFDESVQGLEKDSPVKYRGVPIGRVESIKVAPDATLIEVVMKIEEGLRPEEHRQDVVAQLKSVGITGIMFVEIEHKQPYESDLSPQINFSTKHPVVATKPSEIKQLIKGIDDIVDKIKALDLVSISTKLKTALDAVDQAINDAQLKGISADIRRSLAKVNRVMDSVNRTSSSFDTLAANTNTTVTRAKGILNASQKELSEAISAFRNSMKTADRLMANGATLIKNTDESVYSVEQQLNFTLQNLEIATSQLNSLIGRINDQPSRLIFGEPPPSRSVEPDTAAQP